MNFRRKPSLEAEAEDKQDGTQATPRDFLADLLKHGARMAKDVFDEATAYGYNQRQMQNAAQSLGVERTKLGMGAGWQWRLGTKIPNASEDTEHTNPTCVAPSVSSGGSSALEDDAEVFE
jgi:hypothetical protein